MAGSGGLARASSSAEIVDELHFGIYAVNDTTDDARTKHHMRIYCDEIVIVTRVRAHTRAAGHRARGRPADLRDLGPGPRGSRATLRKRLGQDVPPHHVEQVVRPNRLSEDGGASARPSEFVVAR